MIVELKKTLGEKDEELKEERASKEQQIKVRDEEIEKLSKAIVEKGNKF